MRIGWTTLLLVLLLSLPLASAARFTAAKVAEQIVEGHTVFTVMERKSEERGWNIVGKVRHLVWGPNVLWFNDQWKEYSRTVRQPCGGFVIATWNRYDPGESWVERNAFLQPSGLTYVESYRITDPNGAVWDTDLYAQTGVYGRVAPIWVTTVLNRQIPDDGTSNCAGILDLAPHRDPGTNGLPYSDNLDGIPIREYNFDVFGLWRDVLVEDFAGKEHGENGADNTDGTGCHRGTEWGCDRPEGSAADDYEGNSHPYNPREPDAGPEHYHETARIDVRFSSTGGRIFSSGAYPPNPRIYAVYDTEVVESETRPCDPGDPANNIDAGFHAHC